MKKFDDLLWEMKYRPETIKDCILPDIIKDDFLSMVESKDTSNLLLVSTTPGTGKTTVARALCNELDYDTLFINASESGGIGSLRTEIRGFVSSFSIDGTTKAVILDEFDQTSDEFQKAFRGFIEEFGNVRFILTANYANKIIKPIRSRMCVYEFIYPAAEKVNLIKQSVKRCQYVLEQENIPCTNIKVLLEVVRRNYPDNRAVLVDLQRYSRNGEINEGILGKITANDDISELIGYIKAKKFGDARKLVPKYATDYANFIRNLYNLASVEHVSSNSIGDMILYIAENQKFANVVVDLEIHISALIVELMTQVEWK